ncbi:MRE11 [[Candida] subhashii]|uniref:Double-strand break repair protein n=1 Tax=[Candida] subhashii TaxID=561895 RepID=A0A8J5QEV8_9ASCO|nr:MRE11 [[Candida] subhashii]KAG7664559.1 MRE11 [[Candida] subhashii]
MPLVESLPIGPDTIRILFTTDNHVGAYENDPIRGDDGWKTFHEITKIAKEQDVDMILQGGDLFHINKPTKKSMYHVMKSIRLNCFGDKPCELELLSDPGQCLNNGGFNNVNYEDPNLNISIPIFAISGNHDDSTGEGLLSAMDVLAVSGLVNHFGKIKDTENITISPILFQKGLTKLSLYGLDNLRDERLHRAFRDGIIKFQRPKIQLDEWFNLFTIHQNHAAHSLTSSIPENFLPKFLDFIVWGHEHECIPYPVHNPETGFDVLQAGSSIATSLSEGEIPEKKVFIINILGKDYSIEPIKLKTVRPFVLRSIELSRTNLIPGAASKSDVIAYLTEEVEKAIQIANQTYKENNPDMFDEEDDEEETEANNKNNIPLPLIRLKVEYSGGFEIENVRRFSNRFVGKIANANDVIQFYKKREKPAINIGKKVKFDKDLINESISNTKTTELQLQDIINDFMGQTQLALLPETGLHEAVKKFIDNDDKNSLNQYIEKEIKNETKMLLTIDIDEDEFHGNDENHTRNAFKQILQQIKQTDIVLPEVDDMEPQPAKKATKRKPAKNKDIILSDTSDNEILESSPRRSTPRRGAAAAKKSYAGEDDVDAYMLSSEDEYQEEQPKKTTTRRGGSSTRARGRRR